MIDKAYALIRPFEYTDEVTGDKISVSISSQYSKITINNREYYFKRENGEFDGNSTTFIASGPIIAVTAVESGE